MLALHIGTQETQRGVSSRHDVAGVARPAQRVVEATKEAGTVHAEQLPAPGDIAHVVVRGEVTDSGSSAGWLVDVSVVEHELVAPGGLIIEIVLPPAADDRAAIVAAKSRLQRCFIFPFAIEAVLEQ